MQSVLWCGIYPAVTTQFTADYSVDLAATRRVHETLIEDGVDGLVVLGTCGENNSLEPQEKRDVLAGTLQAVQDRKPVIAGIAELTTARAIAFAKDAEALGASGLMLLPAMVYVPTQDELCEHFRAVAEATSLPIMLYNNPPAYRVSISLDALTKLATVPNIVAIKEAAPDPRRYTDLFNAFGNRYAIMAGLDDIALEGLLLGACGWVSGLTSAFPRESLALLAAWRAGDLTEALRIYRWFMPVLHLDADHDLVQAIKLAQQIVGRGSEHVRLPRQPLAGARRAEVTAIVEKAAATSPCGRAPLAA